MNIVVPLFIATASVVIAGLLAWIGRTVISVQTAITLVSDQLNPPGGKPLREIVSDHTTELAVINTQLTTLNTHVFGPHTGGTPA